MWGEEVSKESQEVAKWLRALLDPAEVSWRGGGVHMGERGSELSGRQEESALSYGISALKAPLNTTRPLPWKVSVPKLTFDLFLLAPPSRRW